MTSLGNLYSPLGTSNGMGSATMRPHSYSAVESFLSADSSISSSSASSSSTSTIASSSSSTSTLTPPEPVSPNSSGGGGLPLWKTLVRPRPWRFVQRSRVGGSLDREHARQEDATLDGDDDRKDAGSESGSLVEGDAFASSDPISASSGRGGVNGVMSSVDSVNRTKSESDIATRRTTGPGTHRPLGFKTRAERFSVQSAKASPPRASAMTRSQTLPPTGRSTLSPAKSQTLPRGPILVDSSRRSRSSSRMDGPKTVTFSESNNVELSPAKSDSSSDKGSDKSDSPSRNLTLNVQDSVVRVSFSKPAGSSARSEKPCVANASVKNKPSADKPDVPAKPARLNTTSNGPVPANRPSSLPTAKPSRIPASKADGKQPFRASSSGGKSPKSPEDEVLFSMGFTVVDKAQKGSQPEPAADEPQLTQELKPKTVIKGDDPSEDTTMTNQLNGVESSEDSPKSQREDVNDNLKDSSNIPSTNDEGRNGNEESEAETEVPSPTPSPVAETTSDSSSESKKPSAKPKDIVPKKMIRIRGDKKAEEKAAKAKKKEQKAKEKEEKAKKKTSPDTPTNERGRIKLFPWKVEFSARDKSQNRDSSSDAQKTKDSKKTKKEPKKGKQSGTEAAVSSSSASVAAAAAAPAGAKNGVHDVEQGEEVDGRTTAPKKDKNDGNGNANNGSSGNTNKKSSRDKKDASALAHPLQDDDDDDDGAVELLQQPPQQTTSSSHHHHRHQHQHPHHPQAQEPTPRPSLSSCSSPPPAHLQSPHPQQQQQQQLHHHQQLHFQFPPQAVRQATPKPRYFDEFSSSDQNSDLESWYGSLPRRTLRKGVRIYESDGETVPHGPFGQDVRRKVVPRRHTVGGAQIQEHLQLVQDTDRKREAFYEMLASRYPQYADKITGLSAYHNRPPTPTERSSRPREPQRRRTVVPSLTHYNGRSMDYDDPGTMSDIELSSFQRGGYARASMPIVRSASTSLERPIGLVFLVYRNETKKALLPNEITSLDTVRALFVRAFPEKLSLEILDSPKQKIYILEPTTSIFFQLEDLRDIKDRTVLKIHECDSDEPQHVRYQIEIRGRATHPLRPASHQGIVRETGPQFREELAKAQSLPVSASQNYSEALHKERLQWEMEQDYIQEQQRRSRSRSLTPEPAERPRSLSAGPPRGRYSHTTESLPTPDRGSAHLNPIPENPRLLANGFRQAAVNGSHYDMGGHPHGHPHAGHPPPPHPGRVISPTPAAYDNVFSSGGYPNPQAYISHSTRAPTAQGPLQATGPPPPPDMRGNNRGGPPHRQSLPFAGMSNPVYESFPQQRTQPYRVTPERDVLPPRPQSAAPSDVGRMERMEAQIASLAAWVHQVQVSPVEAPSGRRNSNRSTSSGQSEGTDTYPASSGSKQNGDSSLSSLPGLSDIPNACSQSLPVVTSDMREKINDVRCRMKELRVELQGLRRMEQLNQEAMKDVFSDTLTKIKKVIDAVPGADDQVVRQQRLEVNSLAEAYRQDKAKVEKELSDLESSVEELKQDVLARKCRVNITDVEGLALVLSNITKSLADLKARYPKVNESLRKVMAGEMEIVVKEEKFIKEEPQNIEAALKRCKKLTSTLYTLKRLATVQDTRPLQVPPLALECKEVGEEEKMAILENIRAMVPDHETRLYSLEAADASRERKKKIVTQQESLKFTKSLQTASKALRPSEPGATASAAQKEETVTFREKDPKKSMGESDSRKSEPPIIPAKPARLLLTRELKHGDTPPSSPRAPMTHTVTVTSQISEDGENETESKAGGCNSARSVFFGSLESPTSEHCDEDRAFIETSPTITISVTTSAGFSQCKPVSTMYYQAPTSSTRRTSSSSSYQSSVDVEDADSVKKVPPPPPPRKSSARYPYGIGPLSPQSPSEGCRSPGGASMQRQSSGEQSPDKVKQGGGMSVYKGHGPLTPTTTASISGPLSSTPKPPTPQKPPSLSKLYKAQAVGGRRPNLQHQRVGADRMFTTFIPPVPAEIVTNSQDPLDEGDLSGSESTGSTTSLDSQKGLAALVRTNSTPLPRGPKPHPPQRCSSLGSRDSRSQDRELTGTTHVVEVKKPLVVGTMTVQLNGLDGARGSGHKT